MWSVGSSEWEITPGVGASKKTSRANLGRHPGPRRGVLGLGYTKRTFFTGATGAGTQKYLVIGA